MVILIVIVKQRLPVNLRQLPDLQQALFQLYLISRLGDFEQFVSEPLLYSRKIHVSVKEFQELMKTKKENGESEHPLETLEELLEVISHH